MSVIKKEEIRTFDDLVHYNIDDAYRYVMKKMQSCEAGECEMQYVRFMLEYKNREMLENLAVQMHQIMEHLKIQPKSNVKSNYELKEDD